MTNLVTFMTWNRIERWKLSKHLNHYGLERKEKGPATTLIYLNHTR